MDSLIHIIRLCLTNSKKLLMKLRNNLIFMYNKQGSLSIMYKALIDEKLNENRTLSNIHKKLLMDNNSITQEITKVSIDNAEMIYKIARLRELLTDRSSI